MLPDQSLIEKETIVVNEVPSPKIKEKQEKIVQKKKTEIVLYSTNPSRDVIDLMEFPFLALSKNRKNPIIYKSEDGTTQIKVIRHTEAIFLPAYMTGILSWLLLEKSRKS